MTAEQQLRDAVLYRSDLGERNRMLSLVNLISNAVSYGMVMGSARTGLGTANPVGASVPGDSLYYQGLHAYSAFDWEFQSRLLGGDTASSLPREIAVLAGRFPQAFVDGLTDEGLEEVALSQKIAAAVAPGLEPFAFRRLADAHQSIGRGPSGVTFSPSVREELWRGTAAKLANIDAVACSVSTPDLAAKLASMASAFAPLSTVFAASFDHERPSRSFTRLCVYLPALHTLHADDVDDPFGWYLQRGVPPLALPVPVQVSAANITHLSYLRGADRTRQQGLRFEVRRDFSEPQTVTMVAAFGRLLAEDSADLLGFDCRDHRDALTLLLTAKVPIQDSDGPRARVAKESFNRAMGGFEIEARIHQLTLHLRRDDPSKPADREQILRPQFSQEESKISFRVQRYTESAPELLSLKAAGFTSEPTEGRPGHLCYREFATWERLRAFLGGNAASGGGLAGMLVTGREKLLGQAVGRATQLVLDHSIESIERSLDKEIAHIVTDYLERYRAAREVLAGRLHEGLF